MTPIVLVDMFLLGGIGALAVLVLGLSCYHGWAKSWFLVCVFGNISLSWFEPYSTFTLAGVNAFWLRYAVDGVLLLAGVVLMRAGANDPEICRPVRAWILYVGWLGLVAVVNSPLAWGGAALVRLGAPFALYLIAIKVLDNWRDVRLAVGAVLASSFIPLAMAVYQLVSRTAVYQNDHYRVSGTYQAHPVLFALYLLIILFVAYAFGWGRGLSLSTVYRRAAFFMVSLLMMMVTWTRGAWLGVVAGFLALDMLQRKLVRPAIIIGVAVALGMEATSVRSRFAEGLGEVTEWREGEVSGSISFRIALQLAGVQSYVDGGAAIVVGRGFQSFAAFYKELTGDARVAPHNDFLYLAYEAGLIGLIFYMALLGNLLLLGLRHSRGSTVSARLYQAATVSLFTVNVLLFFENSLFATAVQSYLFVLFGIAEVARRVERRELATAHDR